MEPQGAPMWLDRLSGAREIGTGVFVFTSGAFALNSGVVLGSRLTSVPAERESRAQTSARKAPRFQPTIVHENSAPRPALLVDPAYFPSDLERISAFLDNRGYAATHLVLTHSDWDHIVGPARFPDATVIASSLYPERVRAEQERIARALADLDAKLYVSRQGPFSIPEPDTLAGSPVDLVWDGPGAHLLPAGGHTPDGLMLLLREDRILFAGDHLSDLEIPFVGDSITSYLATLTQAKRLALRGEIDVLVPGHGAVCNRPSILDRIEEDVDYLTRLDDWVRETSRTVKTVDGLIERCEEVVFGKGWGNPDVQTEHRSNVARHARSLGLD